MARIIYSGIVSTINGSIGGTTFQRNAFGSTVKKKSHQVRKLTPNQQQVKAALVYLSTAWGSLSNAQRATWVSYATNFPQYTRLNPASAINGRSVYMKRNMFTRLNWYSPVSSVTSNAQLTLPTNTITAQINSGSGNHLEVLCSDAPTGAGYSFDYFVSGRVSESQFVSESLTRWMISDQSTHLSLEDPEDIDDAYQSQFGYRPADGDFVLASVNITNALNGQCLAVPIQRIQVITV